MAFPKENRKWRVSILKKIVQNISQKRASFEFEGPARPGTEDSHQVPSLCKFRRVETKGRS